jgi:hypothetical protein
VSFREPNGAVMTNMKPPQEGRNTGAPSLRGLQGRSATGLNGQAAKEEVSALWQGGWMPENISGVPAGRSVFHLTSPLIGLLARNTCCPGFERNRLQQLCWRCRFSEGALQWTLGVHCGTAIWGDVHGEAPFSPEECANECPDARRGSARVGIVHTTSRRQMSMGQKSLSAVAG